MNFSRLTSVSVPTDHGVVSADFDSRHGLAAQVWTKKQQRLFMWDLSGALRKSASDAVAVGWNAAGQLAVAEIVDDSDIGTIRYLGSNEFPIEGVEITHLQKIVPLADCVVATYDFDEDESFTRDPDVAYAGLTVYYPTESPWYVNDSLPDPEIPRYTPPLVRWGEHAVIVISETERLLLVDTQSRSITPIRSTQAPGYTIAIAKSGESSLVLSVDNAGQARVFDSDSAVQISTFSVPHSWRAHGTAAGEFVLVGDSHIEVWGRTS